MKKQKPGGMFLPGFFVFWAFKPFTVLLFT